MTQSKPINLTQRLDHLTELSIALSQARDTPALLDRLVRVAMSICHAEGGTLYRVSTDEQSLRFYISINDTLGIDVGGTSGQAIDMPDIPLYDADGKNLKAVAAYAANTRQSINIPDVYQSSLFNFSAMLAFDRRYRYRSQSFLAVPMKDHEDELIGVLQLINAKDPDSGKTHPFTTTDQRFIEALASQAAVAITNQQLVDRLEQLFESFVKLINIGIDEKSPNTGRHCQHVPELAMMLANAAVRTETGPLAGFTMDAHELKQLWIASLLHDCGKITTPIHVVEKATKLQTIFDRIHNIDTRFEVLRRDAEIRALKEKAKIGPHGDPALEAAIDERLQRELAQLKDDQAFLRRANIGSETMSREDQERVTKIAAYRWSGEDGAMRDLLDQDEVANLSIRSGTLNQQEREIINNHVVITMRMLESLPWPKNMRNVPEYACRHHEHMDGSGYPTGLRGEQMSVPARIMAIADIFEALTARDRPYKAGKTLSESLQILGKLAVSGHVDRDLFNVFVSSKVYLEYANRFLDPAQIDEFDESSIPGYQV